MTIPKDEEASLREQRQVLEAISEDLAFPVYPDKKVSPIKKKTIPPSERIVPGEFAERVEILQRQRDFLLEENAKLLRIVHQLLDQTDQRRHNGRKGGDARSQANIERDKVWLLMAAEVRDEHPGINASDVARAIKRNTGAEESERTIRGVIRTWK